MSSNASLSLIDRVRMFLTFKIKTKFAIKRPYDDWTFKQIWADSRYNLLVKAQTLNVNEHSKLGSDLAVANFVVRNLGGKVRDERNIWIERKRDLPSEYAKSFRISGIQASNTRLLTEGIDNFVGLDSLEYLDLSDNKHLDDFSCDQLSRQFRRSKTLHEIDLSYNPLISIHGLEILFRIPSIKRIIAIGTRASMHRDIDLFTLTAEDERDCKVFVHDSGRQYIADDIETLRLEDINRPRIESSHRSQ